MFNLHSQQLHLSYQHGTRHTTVGKLEHTDIGFSQLLITAPAFTRHYVLCKFEGHRFSALFYILQFSPSTCPPIPLHKAKQSFLYTTNLNVLSTYVY